MRRVRLDARIAYLESAIPEWRKIYGRKSKEATGGETELRALRIERMKRDTNFRKHKRAA